MIDREILNSNDYDSGLLNDFGGGNIDWWFNYIRTEVNFCNEYWRGIIEAYLDDALEKEEYIMKDNVLKSGEVVGEIIEEVVSTAFKRFVIGFAYGFGFSISFFLIYFFYRILGGQ